jgi:hypothetical protein
LSVALVASTLVVGVTGAANAAPQTNCGPAAVHVGNGVCQQVFASLSFDEAAEEGAEFTFTPPADISSVDVFLVGGGGGGGGGATNATGAIIAGGGGAGGSLAIYNGIAVDSATPVTVTVGGGGKGGVAGQVTPTFTSGADGDDGDASSFGSATALGGGGGGGGNSVTGFGGSGGTTPVNPSASDSAPASAPAGAGGAGASAKLTGDTAGYYTAAGGGAGAGGPGVDANITDDPRFVRGGDGGPPSQLQPSDETSLFYVLDDYGPASWENSFEDLYDGPPFYRAYLVDPKGFAPGGGGSAAGIEYCDDPTTCDTSGSAGDDNTGGVGQGAYAHSDDVFGNPPTGVKRTTLSNPWAFGAGGGGGLGTATSGLTSPVEDGSSGTSGLVVVRWMPPQGPVDEDGDGFGVDVDCDDTRPTVNPGAVEVALNGIDDDCNPLTPIGDREDITCDADPGGGPAPLALSSNGYKSLNFSKSADIGLAASAGASFRYDQVGAIGGPTFGSGSVVSFTGSGPWSVVLQVSDTTGISVGDAVTAVRGADSPRGRIGIDGVYTVTSVNSGTNFTI